MMLRCAECGPSFTGPLVLYSVEYRGVCIDRSRMFLRLGPIFEEGEDPGMPERNALAVTNSCGGTSGS
jgi:hypothetical protein